ncbi:aldehyde dehydrogenase family protein, partial [Microbacterium sp. K41]
MPSETMTPPRPAAEQGRAPRAIHNLIAGERVEGIGSFAKISPIDGTLIAEVHEAGAEQVDRAVAAARAAFDGPWGRMTVAERARLLRGVADAIDR